MSQPIDKPKKPNLSNLAFAQAVALKYVAEAIIYLADVLEQKK